MSDIDTSTGAEELGFEREFEFAWNWFQYHAEQRLTSFNFFLIIVGFLLVGYAQAINHVWSGFGVAVGALGVIVGAGFLALDVRNDELIQCGLNALEELEAKRASIMVIADNRDRKFLDLACGRGSVGSAFYRRIDRYQAQSVLTHIVLLRSVIAAVSAGFLLAALWAGLGYPGA